MKTGWATYMMIMRFWDLIPKYIKWFILTQFAIHFLHIYHTDLTQFLNNRISLHYTLQFKLSHNWNHHDAQLSAAVAHSKRNDLERYLKFQPLNKHHSITVVTKISAYTVYTYTCINLSCSEKKMPNTVYPEHLFTWFCSLCRIVNI